MPELIQFPNPNRDVTDQALATAIGHVVLYHERIHRALAQIYKTSVGHSSEDYLEAFVDAAETEELSFNKLVTQAIPPLAKLLSGIASQIDSQGERVANLKKVMIRANKLRNEIVHSSYGIPTDGIVSEELRQILPLRPGATIRERRDPNSTLITGYVTELVLITRIAKHQSEICSGIETLQDAIRNFSIIVDAPDHDDEIEMLGKNINSALRIWRSGIAEEGDELMRRLRSGKFRESIESLFGD
jgi:hypothetical protein